MPRPAPAASRAAELLNLLAAHPTESFSLAELSRRLDVGLGSTHALAHALAEMGYVQRDAGDMSWSLGPSLVAVGDAAARRHPLIPRARAALHDLACRYGLRGLMTSLLGTRLVILHEVGVLRVGPVERTTVGQRLPAVPPVAAIHVAYAGADARAAWLDLAPPVHRSAFEHLLAEVRAAGWLVRFGQEYQPRLRRSLRQLQDEPYADEARAAVRDAVGDLADPDAVGTAIGAQRTYDVVNLAVLAGAPTVEADGASGTSVGLYLVDFPSTVAGAELQPMVRDLRRLAEDLSR
jgi:DNA-binding IclR family transcriptional regulator